MFVQHGNVYVRVSPCRLIKKGDEFNWKSNCIEKKEITRVGSSKKIEKNQNSKKKSSSFDDGDEDAKPHDISQDDALAAHGRLDELAPEINDTINEEVTEPQQQNIEAANTNADEKLCPTATTKLQKIGDTFNYKDINEDDWISGKIVSRAGKAKVKYFSHFNVENCDNKKIDCINFLSDDLIWKKMDVCLDALVSENSTDSSEDAVKQAKSTELDSWKRFDM